MSSWIADFTPIAGFTFRDARPFQANESRTASALPFPPPPGALWSAVTQITAEAATITANTGPSATKRSTHQPVAGGLWLHSPTPGLGRLFPVPSDIVQPRVPDLRVQVEVGWELLRPALGKASAHGLCPTLRRSAGPQDPLLGLFTAQSLLTYLERKQHVPMEVIREADILSVQRRTGVGLEGRKAKDGFLYSEPVMFLDREAHWSFRMPLEFNTPPKQSSAIVRFGGEARHARLRLSPAIALPEDQKLRAAAEYAVSVPPESTSCRVKLVLLTPAVFSADVRLLKAKTTLRPPAWRPWWLPERRQEPMPWLGGATLELQAAIVGRPFPLGAWDSKMPAGAGSDSGPGGPKPLYRAVPAGAVYYLTLRPRSGQTIENAVSRLFDTLWFRTVHINRDGKPTYFGRAGFGITVIGGWDDY